MGNKQKPKNNHEVIEKSVFNTIEWKENITVLDLNNRAVSNFDNNIRLPSNLLVLNLSNNKFTEVPTTVLKLEKLKTLDLSFNQIEFFDDKPSFCHALESLNISNNTLKGPPYWVWVDSPMKLTNLNLSNNINICQTFINYYLEELVQYKTLVKEIDLHNCHISKHMKLLSTFNMAKVVNLGSFTYNYLSVNNLETVPCAGLEDCTEIELLNISNTNIYNIQHNIDIYQYLKEINLSYNNINSLPNEFCNLKSLEICILSFNRMLYLPDNFYMLMKLRKLYLDNNELCMIPDMLHEIPTLKTLDLYNNHLYEGKECIQSLDEYDFAQNYACEPSSEEYLMKKQKLRQHCDSREDGRAPEIVHEDSEHYTESCEEDNAQSDNDAIIQENDSRCSSPEDWDSDDYWIPSHVDFSNPTRKTHCLQWLHFVNKKMAEGNFCPIDMHLSISITDKVKFEKMTNPQPIYESDGQFDDYSDDDS